MENSIKEFVENDNTIKYLYQKNKELIEKIALDFMINLLNFKNEGEIFKIMLKASTIESFSGADVYSLELTIIPSKDNNDRLGIYINKEFDNFSYSMSNKENKDLFIDMKENEISKEIKDIINVYKNKLIKDNLIDYFLEFNYLIINENNELTHANLYKSDFYEKNFDIFKKKFQNKYLLKNLNLDQTSKVKNHKI